jgi:aspartyl-tRNA(Asn)/glutamyl-tRNA(Gln) amidotransferase subunit A
VRYDLLASGDSILSLNKRMVEGDLLSVDLVSECLDSIRTRDTAINSFIHIDYENSLLTAEKIDEKRSSGEELHPLAGIPLAVKDIIAVEGMPLTCASDILSGYISPYNATAVQKLRQCGMVVIGKTNMDEFGMGSSNENSASGSVKNPWDPDRVSGGSSGGSAAAVAAGFVNAALGSDTGGSIRQPASFCGQVGVKPTYGRVSRFGLVAFASSLDHIGTITGEVQDAALLLGAIAGRDPKDSTSRDIPVPDFVKALDDRVSGRVVGVPKEFFSRDLNEGIRENCQAALDIARSRGMVVKEISLPFLKYALPAYYILCMAEASSNLARYDGIRYGRREGSDLTISGLYRSTRSKGFGLEVKRRIMLGSYVLSKGYYDAYYIKGLRARAYFVDEILKAFDNVDLIFSPTTPTPAFKIGEKIEDPVEMYLSDVFTTIANLTGVPAISIPCGKVEGLPVGLQLMARPFGEATMFSTACALESGLDVRGI